MNKLKSTLLIAAWLISTFAMAQGGVSIGNWRTHLPYQKVIGVEPIGNKIYAATQYELFYYDTQDNSINILNKINGLSDIGISTIRYNESQRKLFVAYPFPTLIARERRWLSICVPSWLRWRNGLLTGIALTY